MPNTWVTPHATIVSTITSETVRSCGGAARASRRRRRRRAPRAGSTAAHRVKPGGGVPVERVVVVAVPRAAQHALLDRALARAGPPWCGQWLSSAP